MGRSRRSSTKTPSASSNSSARTPSCEREPSAPSSWSRCKKKWRRCSNRTRARRASRSDSDRSTRGRNGGHPHRVSGAWGAARQLLPLGRRPRVRPAQTPLGRQRLDARGAGARARCAARAALRRPRYPTGSCGVARRGDVPLLGSNDVSGSPIKSARAERRRNVRAYPDLVKPELLATRPNELWSWDITKLLGPRKWTYYYLYVILDVFSRYVVGWMVAHRETKLLARKLIEETLRKQNIRPGQLTLHADRGSSMTSKPVAFLCADLGVTKTHSRPHVSDDNPFSEAQFKTLKYRPEFPARFGSIEAREEPLRRLLLLVQRRAPPQRARHAHPRRGAPWTRRRACRSPSTRPRRVEPPREFRKSWLRKSSRVGRGVVELMIASFELGLEDVAESAQGSRFLVVPPVDPLQDGELDLVDVTPRAAAANDLGLELTDRASRRARCRTSRRRGSEPRPRCPPRRDGRCSVKARVN